MYGVQMEREAESIDPPLSWSDMSCQSTVSGAPTHAISISPVIWTG